MKFISVILQWIHYIPCPFHIRFGWVYTYRLDIYALFTIELCRCGFFSFSLCLCVYVDAGKFFSLVDNLFFSYFLSAYFFSSFFLYFKFNHKIFFNRMKSTIVHCTGVLSLSSAFYIFDDFNFYNSLVKTIPRAVQCFAHKWEESNAFYGTKYVYCCCLCFY